MAIKKDETAKQSTLTFGIREDQAELLDKIKRTQGMGRSPLIRKLIDENWDRLNKMADKKI